VGRRRRRGVATAVLGIAILRFYGNLGHWGWILALPAAAMAGVLGVITFFGLRLAAWLARLAVAYIPSWPRDVRVFIAADAVVIAALLVAFEGSALAATLAFCLPLALVAGCGGWACALALRRARDSTRRWLRLAPDLIAVATVAALLLVLVRHALLTAGPAAGLLFPVAAWGIIRLWRAMAGSPRLAVKAAANRARRPRRGDRSLAGSHEGRRVPDQATQGDSCRRRVAAAADLRAHRPARDCARRACRAALGWRGAPPAVARGVPGGAAARV
jgi:hypothetical protein